MLEAMIDYYDGAEEEDECSSQARAELEKYRKVVEAARNFVDNQSSVYFSILVSTLKELE